MKIELVLSFIATVASVYQAFIAWRDKPKKRK